MDNALITVHQPKSPITEAYRTLETNLNFSSLDREMKTLTITSPGISEGKSTTSANLGMTFSQTGKKTLLVDCDLRCPRLHQLFELPNVKGLSQVLCLKESLDEMKQSINEHLDVLTTGPLPPNPVEFLNSKGMQSFIQEVREQYDRIIFDTPPVGILTDAAIVSAHTDGTLLVVATGKSDIELTLKSKENLNNVKANLLGVVMTMMPIQSKQYYHYYHRYGLDVKKTKRRFNFRKVKA